MSCTHFSSVPTTTTDTQTGLSPFFLSQLVVLSQYNNTAGMKKGRKEEKGFLLYLGSKRAQDTKSCINIEKSFLVILNEYTVQ